MSTSIPSANTSPIPGASFSRGELLARAKNDPKPANFTKDLNDDYLGLIDQYQGATVGDIMATAEQAASNANQKATTGSNIVLGGLGMLSGGLVLGLTGFSPPLFAIGTELAGLGAEIVGGVILNKAKTAETAAEAVRFCTADWAQLMADGAKTQPAPSPAQRAPATPAQQEQPAPAPVAYAKVGPVMLPLVGVLSAP